MIYRESYFSSMVMGWPTKVKRYPLERKTHTMKSKIDAQINYEGMEDSFFLSKWGASLLYQRNKVLFFRCSDIQWL